MPNLLHVLATADKTPSVDFVETWQASHHAITLKTSDLAAENLPAFNADAFEGMSKPEAEQSAEAKAAATLSDKFLADLDWAKLIVVGCAVSDETLPQAFQTWVSLLTRQGRTIKDAGFGRTKGLVYGKKLYVVLSGKGIDSVILEDLEQDVRKAFNHIGFLDITIIRDTGAPPVGEAWSTQDQITWLAG